MRKHYPASFKAEAVLEVLRDEKTLAQVAAERQVHTTMLQRWRQIALEGLPGLFAHEDKRGAQMAEYEKKLEELYAEIGRLTTEVKWLENKGVRIK